MQNVWFKLRTRDTFESIVVTVSFSEGAVRENGAASTVATGFATAKAVARRFASPWRYMVGAAFGFFEKAAIDGDRCEFECSSFKLNAQQGYGRRIADKVQMH